MMAMKLSGWDEPYRKMLASITLSLILFAKLYESKPSPAYTTAVKRLSYAEAKSEARREINLLIKRIEKSEDDIVLDRFARHNDRNVVETIRTKKRNRQRDVISLKPTNWRNVWLKSETGYFLEILPSGKVDGHKNKTIYTLMQLQVITAHIKIIRSVHTGLYLAINKKGKVISRPTSDEDTFFLEEMLENLVYSYSSVKYPKANSNLSWYLGLKRKHGSGVLGRTKRASRTLQGDKATHFSVTYADT